MLSVLRSWDITLVCLSERRNPFWAHRGVQALTPLQPGGPDLGCGLSHPHVGSQRGSLHPANRGESRHILLTDGESLAHPHSLMFSPSARPHSALLVWGQTALGSPAEDVP